MSTLALAALLLAPRALSVEAGQEFTLTIEAQASSSPIGTVEARLAFDPALIEAERFTFAPGWVPLPEPAYERIDNGRGLLIETAGYPRGFSGTTTLGAATFRARRAGAAALVVAGESLMLGAAGEDEFGAGGESRIAIAAPHASAPALPPQAPRAPLRASPPAPPPTLAAAAAAPHAWLSALLSWIGRQLHF
jgi:hypothetical protein